MEDNEVTATSSRLAKEVFCREKRYWNERMETWKWRNQNRNGRMEI